MFNEELDLGDVAAEEKDGGASKADHLVKQEVQENTAAAPCQSAASIVISKVRSYQSTHQSLTIDD